MSTSPAIAYMRLEARLFLREPVALFFTMAFPLLLLSIFGSIWGNEPISQYGNLGYITLSLPGYIGMIIGTSGILTLSANTASYRETGFFRLLQTTPLTPLTVLSGQVVTLLLVTALSTVLLVLSGVAVWDITLAGRPIAVVFAFCEGCLGFFSFGFLLAVLLPSVRSVQVVGMALFFPMLFLSGAGFPWPMLPQGLRTVSQYLPLTPLVRMLSISWHNGRMDVFVQNAIALGIFAGLNLFLISRLWRGEEEDTGKRVGRIGWVSIAVVVWVGLTTVIFWK